jgi:hypothetical protein
MILRNRALRAFTMIEMMISMCGSTIIVGALMFSSMQLQRSLHAGDAYAGLQSDQHRLLDYVTRDLRRAIGIGSTQTVGGSGGNPLAAGTSLLVEDGNTLVVTQPGYYQSNNPSDPNFQAELGVVAADNYVDYGTGSNHAPSVRILFRKEYVASEKCVCFVRHEDDAATIVVRHADYLHLQVSTSTDGCSCTVEVNFTSPYRTSAPPLIALHDHILLRNIRLDQS